MLKEVATNVLTSNFDHDNIVSYNSGKLIFGGGVRAVNAGLPCFNGGFFLYWSFTTSFRLKTGLLQHTEVRVH